MKFQRNMDIFIAMHEIMIDGPPEGLSRKDIMIELKKKKLIDDTIMDRIIYRYGEGIKDGSFMEEFRKSEAGRLANSIEYFMNSSFAHRNEEVDGVMISFEGMTSESYFNYLEFIELQEARKSSKWAMIFSILAIIISLVALLSPTYIKGTIRLDDNQVNHIIKEINTENFTINGE